MIICASGQNMAIPKITNLLVPGFHVAGSVKEGRV